jgi:hypothetical protein
MAVNRGGETAGPQRAASYDEDMQVTVSASPTNGLARRMGPLACAAGVTASATFLATNNPSAGGMRFPTCPFHSMTGLWCPACGLTRGTYQLMHGHFAAALSYNVFTPVVLLGLMVAWCVWLPVSWGAAPRAVPAWVRRMLISVAPAVVIAYAVLRNIPVAPLRALAP